MWVVLALAAVAGVVLGSPPNSIFTDEFAAEIDGGDAVAELVAGVHGLRLKRQLSNLGNVYVFSHPKVRRRHKRSAINILEGLQNDPNVISVEQQILLKREKRGYFRDRERDFREKLATDDDSIEAEAENLLDLFRKRTVYAKQLDEPMFHYKNLSVYKRFKPKDLSLETRDFSKRNYGCNNYFKDPNYSDQWYLNNRGQSGGPVGYDLNVQCVWKKGITGKGVVVSILDDGLDHEHPDLKRNYDKDASTNLNDLQGTSQDPEPDLNNPSNTHGTRCAGEVAAQANNSVCGIGIAYNCKIGGVRMLDGPVTDSLEAAALNFNMNHIDIYSASWGPPDNGKVMEGPHKYCSMALETGVKRGRNGKGSIFVWATGNGGGKGDTCSCDGYVSSIYTLSVGSISDEGLSTYYSEICPATIAVVFTGGTHKPPGLVRQRNPRIKVVTTDPIDGCTLEFQGTSSAAPLAAGCFALVLEANSNLTWRDMQYIVVFSARIPNKKESGWLMNAAGYHVNDKFGFGVLDCGKMVELAQNWDFVPEQHMCEVPIDTTERVVPAHGELHIMLKTDGCSGEPNKTQVDYLEHVQVHIKVSAVRRGDVNIFLYSPHSTRSEMLRPRPQDDSKKGIHFLFMTVFNWGEKPQGNWTLVVKDVSDPKRPKGNEIKLVEYGLTLYGTESPVKDPEQVKSHTEVKKHPHDITSYDMTKSQLEDDINSEERSSDNLNLRAAPVQDERNDIDDLLNILGKLIEEDD